MPASAATLARCLDLRHRAAAGTIDRDAAAWATRAQAQQIIRENPYTTGMIPMRAHNAFFLYWIAAMPVHVSDVRLVLRYLRTDCRSVRTACLDRPEGLTTLAPTVPVLTPTLAARLIGRRIVLCDTAGDEFPATLLGVDGDYVYYRNPRTGRMVSRHMPVLAVVRGAVHTIHYWAGREVTHDGPPRYDFTGRLIESTGYFYSACCSCGEFFVSDTTDQVRRFAVRHHLDEVGGPDGGAP
jgi:hypothetical protein